MNTRLFQMTDLPAVEAFLTEHHLPTAGLGTDRSGLLLVEDQGHLIGTAGLEVHGRHGLLRSVAVAPAYRAQGIAGQLVAQAADYARQLGLTDLYLLTTTAEGYFTRLGFTPLPRSAAPAALNASAEFQGVCPDSAALMHRSLQETPMTLHALPEIHTTKSFLDTLRAAPDLPLEFRLYGESLVPAGYHVTEVKAVSIESMDCGGKAGAWRETVIQLMDGSAAEAELGFMTTAKFLGIYDRVVARVPVHAEAEIRIEYGNVTQPAMQYHLSGVDVQAARVVVGLQQPGVMCKASGASSSEGQCCGPAEPKAVTPVLMATAEIPATQANASACCAPAIPELVQIG